MQIASITRKVKGQQVITQFIQKGEGLKAVYLIGVWVDGELARRWKIRFNGPRWWEVKDLVFASRYRCSGETPKAAYEAACTLSKKGLNHV